LAFFDRLRSLVRSLFTPEPERPEPPREREPPREPPRPPDTPPGGYEDDAHEQRMHEIYTYITGENPRHDNYRDWRELFDDTGVEIVEDNPREIERLWNEFLRAFYLTSDEEGSIARDIYYADSGLGSDRIDWEVFREIKKT
jgi:hypothetical protein